MLISYEWQVALVTGAASGIGLVTARAFGESGATVVLADHDRDAIEGAAAEFAESGLTTLTIWCDVADDASVEEMVAKIVTRLGRLDVAFNNADLHNFFAETMDAAETNYENSISVNRRGVWSCMKLELQYMRRQGWGAIVNCSSVSELASGAERGIYHDAKHGVFGFIKSAALEYADHGIRVNTVCPGLIWTLVVDQMVAVGQGDAMQAVKNRIPMKRPGRPGEIADAVLWLCSDAASHVTGQSITVDGGYVLRD